MIKEGLTSISHSGTPNESGLEWVKVVPFKALADYNNLFKIFFSSTDVEANVKLSDIPLKPNFEWLNVGNDFPLPFTLNQATKETLQGPIFSYSVQQKVPNHDLNKIALPIRTYSRYEWVVVAKLLDGQPLLIGGYSGKGAKFKNTHQTNQQNKGDHHHLLEFSFESSEMAIQLKNE